MDWLIKFGWIVFLAAVAASFYISLALRPLLQRHALAQPNARSSHTVPTPQGGGFAVIGAILVIVAGASVLSGGICGQSLWLVLAATIVIAAVGAIDDVRTIAVLPRLFLQAAAVAIVIAALPGELRPVPPLPLWLERALLGLALLWFVNLVNFMDGIDWMTVAEVVPVTAGACAVRRDGCTAAATPRWWRLRCAARWSALRHSTGRWRGCFSATSAACRSVCCSRWLLVLLAGNGHLAAALLLPLYYVADATITLLRRLANGEPIMQAHRTHFYQRAIDGGFSVMQIVGRVFALNVVLALLAVERRCVTPSRAAASRRAGGRLRPGRGAAVALRARQTLASA